MTRQAHDARFANLRLVSADSHVIEPVALWNDILPADYWEITPEFFNQSGVDPRARIHEMETDTVSAEVLYPSRGLKLFSNEDSATQEACFARYNDWLAEFCSGAGSRLVGIASISAYDIDHAVAEARRCAKLGLRGIQIWQTPHPDLPFLGRHYDPLWAVCDELGLPVSLHIMSGFDYSLKVYRTGVPKQAIDIFRLAINDKVHAAMESLISLILSGALDRFRQLKFVFVEAEAGWLPHYIDQLDYYYQRFEDRSPHKLERLPSQCCAEQIFATFFRDRNLASLVGRLGNVMWSNDYPHSNSTWPHSRQSVRENLAALGDADLEQVTSTNCMRLYRMQA